jgi:hypothetical protein
MAREPQRGPGRAAVFRAAGHAPLARQYLKYAQPRPAFPRVRDLVSRITKP